MDRRNHNNFIKQVHRRIAQISVGPSAIRNQGAAGIVAICRNYFEKSIDLLEFREIMGSNDFNNYLNLHTNNLIALFPENGKSWGAARQGLTLFFREVTYNFYLANYLSIPTGKEQNNNILKNLELPLDNDVAICLMELFPNLPKWKSIKKLTAEESDLYQIAAKDYAKQKNIPRIHLDLEFWRKDR